MIKISWELDVVSDTGSVCPLVLGPTQSLLQFGAVTGFLPQDLHLSALELPQAIGAWLTQTWGGREVLQDHCLQQKSFANERRRWINKPSFLSFNEEIMVYVLVSLSTVSEESETLLVVLFTAVTYSWTHPLLFPSNLTSLPCSLTSLPWRSAT